MRVLFADEQRLLRDGIRAFVSKVNANVEIADADSLDGAISVANQRKFDLALLGHSMSGMDGVNGVRVFGDRYPSTKVVLLTATADSATVLAAVDAGAHGVISKGMSGCGVQHALRLVMAGECYLPASAIVALANSNSRLLPECPSSAYAFRNVHFSPAETEVIPLLLDGLPNKVIAQRLDIDETAVKARLRSIYKKIGAANRAQAVWSLLSVGRGRSA
ncbi:response regulator transcription factor [Magnetospirillum sp. UT-4]|uniref:response regulator n=1 Tax=Magnetospirillum sp. UT-4 TaxID=2681467 RepID=UPI001382D7A5|nr:response regulator transcription factor [Magnetospirillum sp. UT-4]CAA7619612.1 Regulatory protein, LuxR:Response regulator receiver [Magnetospirillum sp. UT-4]